jgi:hypothetical protein
MTTYSAIRSDAWLLLSIIYASRFPPVTLAKILAAGDFVRHACLTYEELNLGLKRLIENGMVRKIGETFCPTELVLITYYLNKEQHTSVRQEQSFVNTLLKNEYWLEVVLDAAEQQVLEGDVIAERSYSQAVTEFQGQRRGKYQPRNDRGVRGSNCAGQTGASSAPGVLAGEATMTNSEVLTGFVEAINHHEVDTMVKWLAKDHVFTDSLGQTIWGSSGMKPAWSKYFQMVPDYEIVIDEIFEKAGRMVLLGTAKGTYAPDGNLLPNNKWQTRAAWKVVFKNERISEWQVFADNEPIRQIIREREGKTAS